ncbi:hypothetical protein Tco_1306558 [Tanacetum coccineum]
METKDTLSSSLDLEEQQMQQIQDKGKKSCMVSFRLLHSHLKLLSNNDLKGTRTECGFKWAFAKLFRQDVYIFTSTMFLNMDRLEKQLDKDEFQEIRSMAAFRVLETQFQKFIKSRSYLDDDDGLMARKYFLAYTKTEVQQFHDTLIQYMESVKKSIDKRALHKREYDSRENERQMQTTEENFDTSKALDASLVNTKSSRIGLEKQDTSSRSGNDTHVDDADIKPIYDEEPMAENAEQCHDTRPLPAKLTDHQTIELSNQSLEFENIYVIETINIELEHKVAKLLKENETLKKHYKELSDSIKTTRAKTIEHTTSLIAQNVEFKAQLQEKGFAIAALKNELIKLQGNSVDTKFAKSSILRKPFLQSVRNQSVVRQPTAFKSKRPRISKPRFASQVNVNNDLPKPITTHYLPKERESAVRKLRKDTRTRWKPTGRILKTVGLKWVPTGMIFTSSTTTVDNEPPHSSNTDITNLHECIQILDSSAGTSINVQEERNLYLSAGTPFNLKKETIKAWIKENVISERPRLHGITLIQEIFARQSS